MKGIQTLDLSSNQLRLSGASALAKTLWRTRSLHEIVLEESVKPPEDAAAVRAIDRLDVIQGCGGAGWAGRGMLTVRLYFCAPHDHVEVSRDGRPHGVRSVQDRKLG